MSMKEILFHTSNKIHKYILRKFNRGLGGLSKWALKVCGVNARGVEEI